MMNEIRFAARSLLKASGFTAFAVLILGLCIGATTAVFSEVEAVLLRPLPVRNPGELYCLMSSAQNQVGLFSIPEFCEYRDRNHSFQGLAAIGTFNTSMVDHGEAQLVNGVRMSAGGFDLMGVQPVAGRLLVQDDDRAGAPKVVVIGEALWRRSFGGSPEAIGRTVLVNGEERTIVGVLPDGFVYPMIGYHRDVCVPLQADLDPHRHQHTSLHYLRVVGRLAPGATKAQALADMRGILTDLKLNYPDSYAGENSTRMTPLADQIVGDSRPMLLTLMGVVLALLLLASTNLAGLLVVRAISRQREFAIRAALGASKAQLVRLVVTECILLGAVGGAIGLLLASWGTHALQAFVPPEVPRGGDIRFDGELFAFSSAVSLLAGLAPALAPVWLFSRSDIRASIATGGRGTTGGHTRIRHLLASIQIALALALLACTGLFLRSFMAVSAERLGFDSSNTMTARLSLPEVGYRDRESLVRLYERLDSRLTDLPGTQSVGMTSLLPLVTGLATVDFQVEGRPAPPHDEAPTANYRAVTPGFFGAMGIPLRDGRFFTEKDDPGHPFSIVVGAALAEAFFPDHKVLGQRLLVEDTSDAGRIAQIVGVVGDVKQGRIEDSPTFDIYIPFRQMDSTGVPWIRYRSYWVVRSTMPPQALESALRTAVHAVDPGIPVTSVHTLSQVADLAKTSRRFTLMIIGFFAGAALLLTAAGVYSVIAYGVVQRTREIGVRLALGARPGQILGLVFREGLGLVSLGAAAGVLAALGLSQFIAAQLYGVSPRDPPALAVSVVLLFLIASLACWLPARRAAKVDPIVALQAD